MVYDKRFCNFLFPEQYCDFFSGNLFGFIPRRLLVFIVVAIIIWFMLEHCTYGTKLRLYGTNAHVAKFSGINTTSLLFRTHITSSICAALGGLMMLATYSSARADYGTNYTMQSILLVVLGGVSPNGGKGKISGVITELQNAIACAGRVFELIDEEPQIPDPEPAKPLPEDDMGHVSLEHVAFSYTPEKKLIEDFNLHVQPGQRIAIVGPTGCGKTTLINLLMRFYDADSGHIQVSGHDVMHMTRHSLRKNYGMVLQETWLKKGTIRENICMGKPDATEEEMIAAAKASHAHSFIRRLSKGYDTEITEDGGNLSQGQKQLLCITRVMLCLPPNADS